MTDRVIVQAGEVPFEVDILRGEINTYIGTGRLAEAILGDATQLNAFACTPTVVPSLSVDVAPGEIYELLAVDTGTYGVIPANTLPILKQGISQVSTNFATPAPGTPGDSVVYLIQISFQQVDGLNESRPFYNPPLVPGNPPLPPIFMNVNSMRQNNAIVQVKTGIPAPTGTEVPPLPDVGFQPAWIITVAFGQSTVGSGDIEVAPGANFIQDKLSDKVSYATLATNSLSGDGASLVGYYSALSGGITVKQALDALAAGVPQTGDAVLTMNPVAPSGWVMMNDGSIGNASSGGTTRANADTQALFILLWNNVGNAFAPVSGGRGGSALADFNANKNITLPRQLGRVLGIAGAGSGLTARSLGQYLGEETHILTIPEMPSHTHTVGPIETSTTPHAANGVDHTTPDGATTLTSSSTGGDGAHNNMQPSAFWNVRIKL